MEYDGQDNPSKGATCRSDAVGKGFACGEVLRENRHRRNVDTTSSQPLTDGLCQNNLIVGSAQAGHHEAKWDKEGSEKEKKSKIPCIISGSRYCANEKRKESLD